MAGYVNKPALVLLGLFLITGRAAAGEEIIWEPRPDIDTGPVYLDPADYPNDPLTKALKREKLEREKLVGEMVVIPAGSFRMGDLNGGGDSDEKPVHRVTIPRPLAVGRYEVTQSQWQAVMGNNPSKFKGGNRPVEQVSWNDAREFIRKLNARTGKKYRLLTEAEWEYAARAGTATKYPWGNAASHEYANYGKDECCGGLASGRDRWEKTSPVGSFPANAFGLYDMHGNVWEWVEDCYADSYSGAPSNGGARTGNNSCYRVYRGGSWNFDPRVLRSANRIRNTPDIRINLLGFRLARTLSR